MLSVQTLMQDARVVPADVGRRPALGRKEQRRLLEEAIEQLPEVPRLIVALRYFEALRPKDIASVLDMKEAEVRQILAEALQVALTRILRTSEEELASLPEAEPAVERSSEGARGQVRSRLSACQESGARGRRGKGRMTGEAVE